MKAGAEPPKGHSEQPYNPFSIPSSPPREPSAGKNELSVLDAAASRIKLRRQNPRIKRRPRRFSDSESNYSPGDKSSDSYQRCGSEVHSSPTGLSKARNRSTRRFVQDLRNRREQAAMRHRGGVDSMVDEMWKLHWQRELQALSRQAEMHKITLEEALQEMDVGVNSTKDSRMIEEAKLLDQLLLQEQEELDHMMQSLGPDQSQDGCGVSAEHSDAAAVCSSDDEYNMDELDELLQSIDLSG